MSLHPAVAAVAGLILLDQDVVASQLAGMGAVTAVSIAVVRTPRSKAGPRAAAEARS